MSDEYRAIAPFYDPVTQAFLRGPRRAAAAQCRRLNVRRILDVGCGTGILANALTVHAETVVGLDASPAMLHKTRSHRVLSSHTAPQGSPLFIRGDALHLPFAPGSFDLAVYALVLHESPAGADALIEAGFSVAPRILVLEWRMPERNLDYASTFWVPIIERMAGRGHFCRYRQFMRAGGVRGLALRHAADIVFEEALAGRSLVLALLEKTSSPPV